MKDVAGPVVEAKKSGKIHPLKVKEVNEAISSVDKSTKQDLQKTDSTLKKCFDYVGRLIISENRLGDFFMKNGLFYLKQLKTKTRQVLTSCHSQCASTTGDICEPRINIH